MDSIKINVINDYCDVLKGTEYYDKCLRIQEEYYKKLGDDYSEVKMSISDEISPEAMKNLLISLVNNNMCLDEYICDCLINEESTLNSSNGLFQIDSVTHEN